MVVSEAIRKEIEEKADLYDAAKEKIKARIENNIRDAVEKLETIKSELLGEVEGEFGKNPFAEFLGNDNSCTDADAKRLLAEQKIPESFGPDEESFCILQQAIDSLKEWRNFIPKNLKVEGITWDSITLTWDKVSDASFYQIEVDGSRSCESTTTNSFTKDGLFPETEHSFRVRAVKESPVSEWSDVVRGRTLKWECVWKECPDSVANDRKYSVDGENPRIATKVNDSSGWCSCYCTIIGNTYIPLNKVTSWNIKILKSMNNVGYKIFIGIAPFDINQNDYANRDNCGWYFYCHHSWLCSGPPHNYHDKEYGPRKERAYVRTGDSVGVVMDTTRGDLSFVLSGVNLSVAYEGIPLDKPLVPCVLLYYKGDSVELII